MTEQFSDTQRRDVLLGIGADVATAAEFMKNSVGEKWWPGELIDFESLPLGDEPHIEAWSHYDLEAQTAGVWPVLKDKLVQFAFPVRSGISQEASYKKATHTGIAPPESDEGLHLDDPDNLTLELHATIAGTVPVLAVYARPDFETLVQALAARNEAIAVSPAMGACLINGLNNWDRIRTLRTRWEAEDPSHTSPGAWTSKFRQIIPHTELYKDRFIILSRGPYSGVRAEQAGLKEEDWERLSFDIRMEHECTHALSLKVFGALRHDLLEELLADWVALVKVFGKFRPDLALLFLGLEDYPNYREGGRLEVYRGDPPLSDQAFGLMQRIAWHCINHLDQISTSRPDLLNSDLALGRLTLALSTMPTEAVAAPDGVDRILARYETLNRS